MDRFAFLIEGTSYALFNYLKVTGRSKIKFYCRVSPISTRLFYMQHVPLNAKVSGYLDLKFHNVGWFKISKIYRKYAKGEKLWNFKYD